VAQFGGRLQGDREFRFRIRRSSGLRRTMQQTLSQTIVRDHAGQDLFYSATSLETMMTTFEQLSPAGRAAMESIGSSEFVDGQQYSRSAVERSLEERGFSRDDIHDGIEECLSAELLNHSAKGVGIGSFLELTTGGRGAMASLSHVAD